MKNMFHFLSSKNCQISRIHSIHIEPIYLAFCVLGNLNKNFGQTSGVKVPCGGMSVKRTFFQGKYDRYFFGLVMLVDCYFVQCEYLIFRSFPRPDVVIHLSR